VRQPRVHTRKVYLSKTLWRHVNWTSARTFYKHYHKEVDNDNKFVNAILN
jgi:hypothetical protein